MKKSYQKILIFEIIVIFLLTLNIFIQSILNKYLIILFILILILIFKKIFGSEKIRKRYTKDLLMDVTITYMIFFILFYLFGLITGFYKTNNYLSLYGIKNFIIPTILIVVLKEYLRSLINTKYEDTKILYFVTFIMFIMLDIINLVNPLALKSGAGIFFFLAGTVLPAISNNIAANYIVKVSNYKINIYWLLVLSIYGYILPIIPDTGDYILSIIRILLPLVICGKVKSFFDKEQDGFIEREYNKKHIASLVISSVIVLILVYFTCGHFRYYAIAIASGSMRPQIYKGDVVVVDQKFKVENIKNKQIIAYKHKGVVVVHRVVNVIKVENKYYFYTKGDANKDPDNYVVNENDIMGIVNIKIPYIGMPTIWFNKI